MPTAPRLVKEVWRTERVQGRLEGASEDAVDLGDGHAVVGDGHASPLEDGIDRSGPTRHVGGADACKYTLALK